MNKRLLLSGIGLILAFLVQAQHIVNGSLKDQDNKRPVRGATIIVRSASDSSFSQSTLSDSSGRFQFKSLRSDSFTIRISSIGFENLVRSFKLNGNLDLGTISLPKISKELAGVTVVSRPPIAQQKGDTVEFNAGQIKVNPDASAEDLTKKVPGITIENGEVKAQGESVRKVTVDGRELFGDDATAALRNLPAEIIDKIQVFDRMSDQAQLTGFNDGNTQKEINIVTKANMRNGQYGRVYAGYGTDEKYLTGGNATILKDDRRISIVGLVNNVNQQNFSSQDLLGVTSNSGGGGRFRGGGGGNFRGGGGGGQRGGGNFGGGGFGGGNNFYVGQQNGINKTNAFGINYSDNWGKKIRITGSYFFNNSDNTTNQTTNTQYFSAENQNREQSTLSHSNNTNHRLNLRMEYKIDSFNQIIFTPNVSFQNNKSNSLIKSTSFFNKAQLQSETANNTTSDRNGNNINSNLLYSHSFRKRGRTFSVNLNTSYNNRDGGSYLDALTRNYQNGIPNDTVERRFTDQYNNSLGLSANVSYTEPISKNSQLQLNYNPSYTRSNSDQKVFDYDHSSSKYTEFNDSLANVFDNFVRAQNGGLAYRYGTNDKQLSVGLNYQQTDLENERTYPSPLNTNKRFSNFLPNAMMRFKLSQKSNIRLFYRTFTNAPSVTQLQDVIDINRPNVTEGNPDLKQQYSHMLSTTYTFTNTAKGLLFVGSLYVQKANDYITNATYFITDPAKSDSLIGHGQVLFQGDQLLKPVNLDGYTSLRSFFTFAVPMKFIKSNLNLNSGISYSKLPGLVNNLQNESKNTTYTIGTVIASNVSQYVDFTVSYSANFNNVKNDEVDNLNQKYFNHVASLQMNLLSKNGWFFQNDLNNQLYNGLSDGYNQNYWLWNMSAGRKFLKNRKAELKLSVFDLLKQNRSISRTVLDNGSGIQDTYNDVLQQYFMLTFTYNLRNFGTAKNNNRGNRMNTMF